MPILARSGFRRLLWVRLPSHLGDGFFLGALAGSLLFNPEQQTDALAVAVGFAILFVPYSLLGPYVGVVLDRWDRRTAMAVTNLARAGLAVPVAALVSADRLGVAFAITALLVLALNRFFLAAVNASLPRVVEREQLVTANAVAATLGTVAYGGGLVAVAGLVTGGAIEAGAAGYASAALLAVVAYLGSAAAAGGGFPAGGLGPDPAERPRTRPLAAAGVAARGLVSGLRHLLRRPVAGYALAAQAGHRTLFGVLTLAVLLLFGEYFGADQDEATSIWETAQVVLAAAGGAALAAVVTPPAARRTGTHAWIVVLLLGACLTVLVLGPPLLLPLAVLAGFAMNSLSHSLKIVVDATLQRECADRFRGRVFSVNDAAYHVCFVLGLFAGAAVLPPDGASVPVLLAVAAGYGLLAVGYGTLARPARSGYETSRRSST